jgi:hypothetical protein
MVAIMALWLPILVSAICLIPSSLIHMVFTCRDYVLLNEDGIAMHANSHP